MIPTEASKKKNEGTVYFNLYGDTVQLSSKPKFKVGDKVRISNYKRKLFDKDIPQTGVKTYSQSIRSNADTNPITYLLKDLNNNEIKVPMK